MTSFPPVAGLKREQYFLDRFKASDFDPFIWHTIRSIDDAGNELLLQVTSDALKMDGIRINLSAKTTQLVADLLWASLLTPKLADLIWLQRDVTIEPKLRAFGSSTVLMISHSEAINRVLKADALYLPETSLVSTVGKHWVLDNAIAGKFINRVAVAMNYGWHFDGAGFQSIKGELAVLPEAKRLIQGRGTRHDCNHTDYSQTASFMSRICTLNGVEHDLVDIMVSAQWAHLVSHQGPLLITRQPGA